MDVADRGGGHRIGRQADFLHLVSEPPSGAETLTMTTIITLVSDPLYGALGPRAFWFMALLCAAALPIAFAMRGISTDASGSKPIQPAPR